MTLWLNFSIAISFRCGDVAHTAQVLGLTSLLRGGRGYPCIEASPTNIPYQNPCNPPYRHFPTFLGSMIRLARPPPSLQPPEPRAPSYGHGLPKAGRAIRACSCDPESHRRANSMPLRSSVPAVIIPTSQCPRTRVDCICECHGNDPNRARFVSKCRGCKTAPRRTPPSHGVKLVFKLYIISSTIVVL